MHTQLKDGVTVIAAESVVMTGMEVQIVRQLFANFINEDEHTEELAGYADTTVEAVVELMRELGVRSAT